jgi:hypothetical protein
MADDQYVIQPPPRPEGTQLATHPKEQRRVNIAIGVACLAAIFTLWQACEAHQARVDAKKAVDLQAKDVERSRKAAEDSAQAANRGADAAWSSVTQLESLVGTGQAQIRSSERMFQIEHQPLIASNAFSFKSFTDKSPRMDPSKPTEVTMGLVNSGKPAYRCQVKISGKFDEPTDKFEYPAASVFPAIFDFGIDAGVSIPLGVTPLPSLSPASGKVRLYLYWHVDCAKTLVPNKPYHSQFCVFFPVSNTGEVVDFVHGCSEGNPRRVQP